MPAPVRRPPSIQALLESASGASLAARYGRARLKDALRRASERVRRGELETERILESARLELEASRPAGPARVVNATGVLLHTNLGRAPLAQAAREAVLEACGFSALELDLASGRRGRRELHVVPLLMSLFCPGREDLDAAAVVNAAAALLLSLDTLANGLPVVVSRGELVAIGGDFRVPSILAKSGATLREVGTTNKTTRADYEEALDGAGAILKVRPSNYRIVGFTEEVPLSALGRLSRERGVPLVFDAGAAAARPLEGPGLRDEPLVLAAIEDGADLVCFSGDKTLGGPQAGIVVGRRELMARLVANPLARALRLDKMALAALAATLELHLSGREAEIPFYRMLEASLQDLENRARAIARAACELGLSTTAEPSTAIAGGGTGADAEIPSFAVVVEPPAGADSFAAALRTAKPPVIARIQDDRVFLDLRTVAPDEDEILIEALASISDQPPGLR